MTVYFQNAATHASSLHPSSLRGQLLRRDGDQRSKEYIIIGTSSSGGVEAMNLTEARHRLNVIQLQPRDLHGDPVYTDATQNRYRWIG